MKLTIEIPKEYEKEFTENKFGDTFQRVMADIYWNIHNHETNVSGNYEYETLDMLEKAFEKAKIVEE